MLERARRRYALSERQAEIIGWFLDRKNATAFLEHAGLSRSTFSEHQRAILPKAGDESLPLLAARLWEEAAREE